jgi:hypothetical protein
MAKEKDTKTLALVEPSPMFTIHCQHKFEEIENTLDHPKHGLIANHVSITELTAIVTNGLQTRVEHIDKRLWAIAGVSIVTLIGVVIQLILHE